jgi:hypothetical protein
VRARRANEQTHGSLQRYTQSLSQTLVQLIRYLWALRAIVKLVGQEETSAITDELEKRGVRWLLHALFNSLDGKGFPLENSTPATPAKYAQDIACLAVSEVNARLLLKLGGVEVLARTVTGDWSEQTQLNMKSDPVAHASALEHATLALSHLSYMPEAQEKMQCAGDLMHILRELVSPDGEDVIARRRTTPRGGGDAKKAPTISKDDAAGFRKAQQDPDYVEPMQKARKHASLILFQLEEQVKRKEQAAVDEREEAGGGGDGEAAGQVMLSYCWGNVDTATGKFPNQEKVRRMKNALEKRGYLTWMDVEKMSGSTLGAMADAVEESAAIMIVMTKCVVPGALTASRLPPVS